MRLKPTTSVALFLMFLLVAQTTLLAVTNDVNTTMLTSETNGEDSFSVSARNSPSWSTPVSLDSTDEVGEQSSLAIDSNDNLHVTYIDATTYNLDYMTYDGSSWSTPVSLDSTGDVGYQSSLAIDSNDHLHVTYYDYTNDNLEYLGPDFDGDNVADIMDACPYNYGTSTEDRAGCIDTDGDGWSDLGDDFHNKATQWKDSDGDGLGDNYADSSWSRESHWPTNVVANAYRPDANPFDFDNDGYEDEDIDDAEEGDGWDACPTLYGTSSEDRGGCIDNDGDGYSNPTSDWDEDDGADEFPGASTQWEDADDDGYGDNAQGNYPDSCTSTYGTSYIDVYGCVDNDNDGYSELNDVDDDDDEESSDSDGDGYGDSSDEFPYDSSQWNDTDGDGYGDNATGNNPDAFPNDPYEWDDSDGDGYGDNYEDWDPYDSTQFEDEDDDGYGDNISGNDPDMFPNNSEEWADSDDDGYGDNEADAFPYDSTQFEDEDDDGYGDNTSGNNADAFPGNSDEWADSDDDGYGDNEADSFPYDSTQYEDNDNDGYGDNTSGNNADIFPDNSGEWADTDGDGYGDNYEDYCPYTAGNVTMSMYQGCPDADNDTYADIEDAFDNDASQWSDYDGDGYGDNSTGTTPDSCQGTAGTSTMTVSYNFTTNMGENVTMYGCLDSDSDGYDDNSDPCPYTYGNSWVDYFGCADTDQDGISDFSDPYPNIATDDIEDWDNDSYADHAPDYNDNIDQFPEDSTQWNDTDYDMYGDNPNGTDPDAFPLDSSQWEDYDGDGYGDNYDGNNADQCVYSSGNSTLDRFGCADSDGDGISNPDGDWSVYDGADAFISDITQWSDEDGDGYGDEMDGNTPDQCPNQPGTSIRSVNQDGENESFYGCEDRDNDGYDDQTDPCPNQYGTSWVDRLACIDDDGDGISNAEDPEPFKATANIEDWDGDGYLDHADNESMNTDDFPYESTQWMDSDGDGYGDNMNGSEPDIFPNEYSQWMDSDGDGYGDNNEVWAYMPDACTYESGNSTVDRNGCIDSDGDGYSDASSNWLAYPYGPADSLPYDSTQWEDLDGDGCGDDYQFTIDDETGLRNETGDAFPTDDEQCSDEDGDGYGEEEDAFPEDDTEFEDTDRDGYGDNLDEFDLDSTQFEDSDGDTYGDDQDGRDADAFPDDPDEWKDSDRDGLGDNADVFPNDPAEQMDSDNDNVGDNSDAFPFDPTQTRDSDFDGYGDNKDGFEGDQFTNNPTQWYDRDMDGYGDNEWGSNPDSFPDDANEWFDYDGDGRGDNLADKCYDLDSNELRACIYDADNDGFDDDDDQFPQEKTQWVDDDFDGKGDNCRFTQISEGVYGIDDVVYLNINSTTAFNGDCSLNDRDNDGRKDPANPVYTDSNQIQIKKDSLVCTDFGTFERCEDAFPDDPNEWADNDEDGTGDNADQDDDNDGVSDKVEEDSGTDSFSSASKPFAGVDIPLIDINLQEWDLITIGIGGPSALYLAFTFLSRNRRTEEFEELIHLAESENDLQVISDRYERALQMRLIGPHQGLRLERIRSKRENILEYDMVEQHNMEVNLLPKQAVEIPSSEEE